MHTSDWYPEFLAHFADEQEFLGDAKPVNRLTPLVSVCIGAYEHADFIRECLDSVLMQVTDFPFEVIVGEDASTDGTREICIDYATRHQDRIRLFLRSRDSSVYVNGETTLYYNERWCRLSARGKYIALSDGDDTWTDAAKLQKQVDFLESRPDVSLCGHRVEMGVTRGQGKVIPEVPHPLISTLADVVATNWVPTTSIVLRRAIACENPEWARNLPWADWPLHVIAAQHGKIAFLDEVMAFYRVHPGGMWSGLDVTTRRKQVLSFYEAVRGQVPRECWDTVVRPRIAQIRRQLSEGYQTSGDVGQAVQEAWRALLAGPYSTVGWVVDRAAPHLPEPVRRIGRPVRNVVRKLHSRRT